jgi:hypothetical protein
MFEKTSRIIGREGILYWLSIGVNNSYFSFSALPFRPLPPAAQCADRHSAVGVRQAIAGLMSVFVDSRVWRFMLRVL